MATRSTISLKVSESDKGKVFHFDENKLPNNFTCENACIDKVGDVKIEKDYLTIYHHWDGYPEGVGKTINYTPKCGEIVYCCYIDDECTKVEWLTEFLEGTKECFTDMGGNINNKQTFVSKI